MMNKLKKIRIGTRGSQLALAQTQLVISQMKKAGGFDEIEIVEIKTMGDRLQNVSLDQIGGKGVFIKEIEEALLRGDIDMAVHSLKDMPAVLHEDLILAAFLPREDVTDCFISRNGQTLENLPKGAIVGTSSLRREYQIKTLFPDLEVKAIRGNVNNRLKKLEDGQYDAIVLASAGLIRLGLADRITHRLDIEQFIPAVCQGIIAIEIKKDNHNMETLLTSCDDAAARTAALCERAFLRKLNGNCKIPIAAYCHMEDDTIHLSGMLGDAEKLYVYKDSISGKTDHVEEMGLALAERILNKMPKN